MASEPIDLRAHLFAAVERDGDGLAVIDDVIVGDDVAVSRDDETGAERDAVTDDRLAEIRRPAAEAVEELLRLRRNLIEIVVVVTRLRGGVLDVDFDRDDGGLHVGNDVGERRRRVLSGGGGRLESAAARAGAPGCME